MVVMGMVWSLVSDFGGFGGGWGLGVFKRSYAEGITT